MSTLRATDRQLCYRIRILSALVFCTGFIGLSAAEIVPGYVIHSSGDTAQGYIKISVWARNPQIIYFKKSLKDPFKKYGPQDIRGFYVNRRKYISAEVDIENSEHITSKLQSGADFMLRRVHAFLLTLVQGAKSLYLLKDEEGKEHYYIWNGNTFELLLYKRYKVAGQIS
jgi:hypothetical protein